MDTITVLLADDNADFRSGLQALLSAVDDISVVGEAADGTDAVTRAARLQPDVVLMDINMPGLDGIEATRRITAATPHIGVVVLTMFEDDDSVFAALRAGARGYVLKGALRAQIVRAVRSAAEGEAVFGPAVARRIAEYFNRMRPTSAEVFPQLSDREREILSLVAQHLTNPEIARRLDLAEKTVRNNVSNIFTKLQVAGRAEAIIRARDAGLGR